MIYVTLWKMCAGDFCRLMVLVVVQSAHGRSFHVHSKLARPSNLCLLNMEGAQTASEYMSRAIMSNAKAG